MKHTAGMLAIAGMLIAPLAHADVILHAFNWKYSEVTAKADLIKSAGYKQVLISPPLKSSGNEWWARYQPRICALSTPPLATSRISSS